ncbi:hypothetical protein PV10_05019 [Exophiala mesophila]|uniref:DUF1760-domain-containing protein n=1 Tax=Exophiala mesophila TaxID=212818 RepID=A0A0D1ZIS1_EXOME|nr:uncharacterized protein PV10_05019 [Exophiala mesophila]KIV93834.1 hypothetical protein PV10_05019 [Exophiala mesophila]
MAAPIDPSQDPLVAALPPATDYVTYLTLLEYQLTSENLPTLTRLLTEDDGTLAEEIGWDLLKLVLRLLVKTPPEANRCLEIISRRGNPREVVVRVAEELEQLGETAIETPWNEQEDDNEGDQLPTFAGEAPRVHLGDMTLDGMKQDKQQTPPATKPQSVSPANLPSDTDVNSLKFTALVRMLGILHPRIKTQYPSRFLATSLPAALGAYRHIPITEATTISFLDMLEKLAAESRPPLPPRASATQVPTTASQAEGGSESANVAVLPDPESNAEKNDKGVNSPSPEEKVIVTRLLQAVLLEVLDEYLSSFTTLDDPSMSWTSRLREQFEPKRVVPTKTTETKRFENSPDLKQRDAILMQLGKLSKLLGFGAFEEVKKLGHDDDDDTQEIHDPEHQVSEYPTTPSQIPLPANGIIFLCASQLYLDSQAPYSTLPLPVIAHLIDHTAPLSASPTIPNPALLDSLLSLLYRKTVVSGDAEISSSSDSRLSHAKFLLLLSTLTQLFTITPWADLRDSLHYVATKLLHAYPESATRLQVVAQTVQGSTLSSNWDEVEEEPTPVPGIDEETGLTRSISALQPNPIPLAPPQQLGVLRSVGVDWLKDEFLTRLRQESPDAKKGLGLDLLADGEHEFSSARTQILDVLLPDDLPSLASIAKTHASTTSSAHDEDDSVSDFLLNIPFYISTLNLLYVVAPQLSSEKFVEFTRRARGFVKTLNSSLEYLSSILKQIGDTGDNQGQDNYLLESLGDVNALQDSLQRVVAISNLSS